MIMNVMAITQIEEGISRLSLYEQMLLLERLIQRLRQHLFKNEDTLENQLEAMANDVEIQNELRQINDEFAITEMDGLAM
jgi:hypothetical protein